MSGDDDYEIPETGAVFTFGRSRFAENLSSHFFVRNDPVEEISCGDEHTALVCKSGRVFLFGRNDYGQLGFGHNKIVNKPSCLKYLKPFHSIHIACGKDGQLGTGDLNDRGVPQTVQVDLSEGENISAVAAGCHHSAFLTDKGDVYLWGSNSDGQCGTQEPYMTAPHKLQFDQPITSISCGYYHTAFISFGEIYTFGEEDNGKLGRARKSSNEPERVDISENCVLVSCGGSHTMVLTEEGVLYGFGSNFSGQLGIGNSDAECSTPKRVEFPDQSVKISHISCGESHSAFTTEDGALYTCGDSRYGKLCNEDDSTNYMTPTLIEFFDNYFCTSVSCGGCHTMVLAKTQPISNHSDVNNLQKIKAFLPPLKTHQSITLIPNDAIEHDSEEPTEEVQNNGDNMENFDGKSNTESNLINDEVASHLDEIYTEIEETLTENQPKSADPEPKDNNNVNESFDKDAGIVSTKRGIGKLFNVFKRKKSASAILLDRNTEEVGEKEEVDDSLKTVNQNQSKTCTLL